MNGVDGNSIRSSDIPNWTYLYISWWWRAITSNMMAVTLAVFDKKLKPALLLKNLVIITLANLVGALFVAYRLGHLTGLTEGVVFEKTVHTAEAKVNATFSEMIFSGIGCNWLVGMGAWLSFCAKGCKWKNNWDVVSNYDIRSRWFSTRCSQYVRYPSSNVWWC